MYGLKKNKLLLFMTTSIVLLLFIGFYKIPQLHAMVQHVIDAYLSLLENIADRILHVIRSTASIRDHQVLIGKDLIALLDGGYLLKKWSLFLFLVCWITPTRMRDKLLFSGILLLANFTGSLVNIGLTAHLLSLNPDPSSIPFIGRTPYVLLMITLGVIWTWRKRHEIMNSKVVRNSNLAFLGTKLPAIFIVIYATVLLGNLFLGLFKYTPWINFLFGISAGILNMLNYPAWVESGNLLVGEAASIFMAKQCLGFNTMLLFAAIVYITGRNNYTTWLFILGGLILLNIANIIRFVLVFIYITKHGGYNLEIDIHALYNIFIYIIVFILWIIWFETWSYLKQPATSPQKDRPLPSQ
jgi:exosortase/archaeosortase family protein